MTHDSVQRYYVRPLEKSDIATMARWFTDLEDLSAFDRSARIPLSLETSEEIWSEALGNDGKNGKFWFAIDGSDSNSVGIIGLESFNVINGDAVVALYIAKALRQEGLGVRALALVVDIGFRQLRLNRITSYIRADNEGSRKISRRIGFQVEGCLRQAWFTNGRHADMLVVGLLKDEWMDRRTALMAELDGNTTVSFGSSASPGWSWPPK
jgi:RimJ/RimL family protein N-acetyltransferase